MDSHLSNAQRCARKADSLVKYGMYDEALNQLDQSIAYLYELKAFTTRYENIQMLNVQIESIDRKKRSIAIKRSESIKKKNRIESLIGKTKTVNEVRVQHISASQPSAGNKSINKFDQSPVIIEYCFNSDNTTVSNRPRSETTPTMRTTETDSMFVHGRKKLDKDDKSIIEELSTTNAEYKKVNSYLADEIEQLKKENDQLKVELIKIHMSDSLTSSDSSISATNAPDTNNMVSSSTPKQMHRNSIRSNFLNSSDNGNEASVPCNTTPKYTHKDQHVSSASSSASSSSWSISTSSHHNSSQKQKHINKLTAIDLSKYIDDDDDDEDFGDHYDLYHGNTDEESDISNNNPPLEFTIDSV